MSKRVGGRFVTADQHLLYNRALVANSSCWVKEWVVPQGLPSDSPLKVLKWVRSESKQQFNDESALTEFESSLVQNSEPTLSLPEAPASLLAPSGDSTPLLSGAGTPLTSTSPTGTPGPEEIPTSGLSAKKPHPLANEITDDASPSTASIAHSVTAINEPTTQSGLTGVTSSLTTLLAGPSDMDVDSPAPTIPRNAVEAHVGTGGGVSLESGAQGLGGQPDEAGRELAEEKEAPKDGLA